MASARANILTWTNTPVYGSIATFIIGLLSNTTTTFGGAFVSSLIMTVLYAAVVGLLSFIVRATSGKGDNLRMATIAAFGLCMIAPVVMASQEWNDHDRSDKTLAPSMARNYLESCAPNAILFTFGDNDTYPL